jgi:hypothetical protein
MPPDDLIGTLILGAGHYLTSQQALARAKELAEDWARDRLTTASVQTQPVSPTDETVGPTLGA